MAKNAAIIKDVSAKIRTYAGEAIVIVVTNPLDAMTYLAWKVTGFKRERVFGMAGLLDGSRFAHLVAAELKIPRSSVETYMLGSHGDTMLAVLSQTRIDGKPIKDILAKDVLEKLVARARDRGAEIVGLFGTGSAYYSPSAATFKMIDHILNDTKTTVVASVCLNGEYGLRDITIGVPCKIGKNGIEEIVVLPLSDDEKSSFLKSAQAIKKSIELLK